MNLKSCWFSRSSVLILLWEQDRQLGSSLHIFIEGWTNIRHNQPLLHWRSIWAFSTCVFSMWNGKMDTWLDSVKAHLRLSMKVSGASEYSRNVRSFPFLSLCIMVCLEVLQDPFGSHASRVKVQDICLKRICGFWDLSYWTNDFWYFLKLFLTYNYVDIKIIYLMQIIITHKI